MSGYGFVAIVCQAMQELRAVAGAAVCLSLSPSFMLHCGGFRKQHVRESQVTAFYITF